MVSVHQTNYCCAIYEMGNLDVPRDQLASEGYWDSGESRYKTRKAKVLDDDAWWDKNIKAAVDSSRGMGSRSSLPRVIMFADHKQGSAAREWEKALTERGYRVEKVDLGLNPKSGNEVEMFLWFPTKARKKSSLSRSAA